MSGLATFYGNTGPAIDGLWGPETRSWCLDQEKWTSQAAVITIQSERAGWE